jgi:hypothetical protein
MTANSFSSDHLAFYGYEIRIAGTDEICRTEDSMMNGGKYDLIVRRKDGSRMTIPADTEIAIVPLFPPLS